jgi:hypothetical protein
LPVARRDNGVTSTLTIGDKPNARNDNHAIQLRGLQCKVQQARDLLAPVYGWFTEGFEERARQGGVSCCVGAMSLARLWRDQGGAEFPGFGLLLAGDRERALDLKEAKALLEELAT